MRAASLLLLLLVGCDESAPEPPDLAPLVGTDQTVTIFDGVTFNASHQSGDQSVALPDGLFASVTLHIDLACPSGGCDPYDRLATIGIVDAGGGDGGADRVIEIGRFITPFGVGGAWDIDVTDLEPLLHGARVFRGTIETYAKGWIVTARLVFVGGVPARLPIAVLPLAWGEFPIGDPSAPTAASVPAETVQLPPDATSAAVRLFVTGHGQGNTDNCGEFCELVHHLGVDGAEAASLDVWRADCDQNPINNQKGTWMYSRAGWCPGADVKPWRADLGVRTGSLTLDYAIDPYVNQCSPTDCLLSSCAFALASCAYDGGTHTPPRYVLSAAVIAYR